jgi:hypothetical protein
MHEVAGIRTDDGRTLTAALTYRIEQKKLEEELFRPDLDLNEIQKLDNALIAL